LSRIWGVGLKRTVLPKLRKRINQDAGGEKATPKKQYQPYRFLGKKKKAVDGFGRENTDYSHKVKASEGEGRNLQTRG